MGDKKDQDNFLFCSNSVFLEELYEKFCDDPDSLSPDWQSYFNSLGQENNYPRDLLRHSSWPKDSLLKNIDTSSYKTNNSNDLYHNAKFLLETFRSNGHLVALVNPLNPIRRDTEKARLDIKSLGLDNNDLNGDIKDLNIIDHTRFNSLKELYDFLHKVYCSTIGYEFAHIPCNEQKDWLYQKAEELSGLELSKPEKTNIIKDLIEIEGFEQFLQNKFPGAKRFSIEGSETSIIALNEIIKTTCAIGDSKEVIIGMSHRGRLSVLTKILKKSYESVLSEFQGNFAHAEGVNISGDVKYHLGKSSDLDVCKDKKIHLSLTPNPSHLEAVNPVVQGKVRAKQDALGDNERKQVMGVLIHGDAAFAGQGVVAEALSLGDLDGYHTGGIIHIIVNNQIGFTTLPKDARVSRYPTEFAKIIQAPVIHVNGNDPEAVAKTARLAEEYRSKFKKDVIIDVFGYRKFGHNEGDEPMFTQPVMYKKIKEMKSVVDLYKDQLIEKNNLQLSEFENFKTSFINQLNKMFHASTSYKPTQNDWLAGKWSNMTQYDKSKNYQEQTAITTTKLLEYGRKLTSYPENFNLNKKLARLFKAKDEMFASQQNIDWATAESLAFASLIDENYKIRMTGQDVKRGTFSHRHAVLFDQETEEEYSPLQQISKKPDSFEIYNSNLSEFAVLGFEYGYSTVDPNCLTIWEAQFGDFSNGAQIIIDQFISSAENKWLRMSGLVMLLPHGYEGQGPEHSSARLERYLQLSAEENMQVVNCTTPANYFHVLRRQLVDRNFRKPLVVMSPKSLLRHKKVISTADDFVKTKSFSKILDDNLVKKDLVRRVIICSGKVYYDLLDAREELDISNVAIIRIEQYYPFPTEELKEILTVYQTKKVEDFIWVQEEPKNMGAWYFLQDYINDVLSSLNNNKRVKYVGRRKSASPASGYLRLHLKEQEQFINEAIKI